ncbi:hypothetical protein QVD17_12597 [Tagetes erecta]|uniref:SWIM-type domain-containing protein n=1 Tax=Tagetes erecta TaxID=13708 RepID=A0AAD8L181_TARER|nr:hypothetical protein QVD17_12597 [Tagetes erecta]
MAPPIFAIPIQQDDFIPNFDSSSMNQDSSPTTVFNTPNGTLSWIPNVPVEFKPFVGMKFSKMDDIIKMYDRYADLSGFSTRLSTLRKIEGPLLVLTDQDPAMKQAVAAVFTQSRHRLCMWHIMKKLPSKVKMDPAGDCVSCSCMSWTRIGYLCRHIFCVFRFIKVNQIPDKYISSRWRRGVLPKSVYNLEHRYGVDQSSHSVARHELMDFFNELVDQLRSDPEGMLFLTNHLKTVKRQILENIPQTVDSDDPVEDVIAELLGAPKEVEVTCSNPQGIRNKG